jgi:hypothetical protein
MIGVTAYSRVGHDYLSVATCEREGKADPAVVAVVDTRGAEDVYETVRWATRPEQGRFIQVPTAAIRRCNEGYGE